MKFRFVRLIFVIIVIAIIICAIYIIYKNNSKNQNLITEQTQKPLEYAKDIRLGISNFDTINPLITNNKDIVNINKLIFEPLFTLNEEYKLIPCIATEYAKTSETTYIVKINNNIKWSNGEDVSADDVVYTVENLKKTNSIYTENIKNIAKIEAIDSNTIKIELYNEEVFFEYNLIFPIISRKYYGDDDYITSNKIPIGTGMLKIDDINTTRITLKKNPNWLNTQNQELMYDNVQIFLYNSMGELYNAFKIGNVDFINTSNANYSEYIGTIGYYTREYKGRNVDYISINCKDPILSDMSVRKAIAYAIDKEKIISSVYDNKYCVSDYPIDYGTFAYKSESTSLGYNQEQAKLVLENAGWINKNNKWIKDGKSLTLTIIVNNKDKRPEVAELIKEQLKEIGITINIANVSDNQYENYLQSKNYQIILTGVRNAFSPDLTYFYEKTNVSNYNNEEVKSILNEIKNITDEKLLLQKYTRVIEITKQEVPYICLYRDKNTILIKQNAGGQIIPNNYFTYYNFWSWHRK